MKKVWKWVIGIVVVLVVVAALVGGAFLLRNHFANVVAFNVNRPGLQVPGNGRVPGNGDGQRLPGPFPGMRPFGNDGYGMHMRGFGMMGFGRMMPLGWNHRRPVLAWFPGAGRVGSDLAGANPEQTEDGHSNCRPCCTC